MITKAPINRLPSGFLGFVDVKQMGRNPDHLTDQVAPIIDMQPYYAATGRRTASSTIVNLTLGVHVTSLVVPDSKAWVLESIIAQAGALIATQELMFAPALRSAAGELLIMGDCQMEYVASDIPRQGMRFHTPYIALPGTQVAIVVPRLVNGPIVGSAIAAFTEVDY